MEREEVDKFMYLIIGIKKDFLGMASTGILSWPRSGGYIFLILFPAQLILNTGCSEAITANIVDVFNCTLDDALHYEAYFLMLLRMIRFTS